jgi:hypothetical protein
LVEHKKCKYDVTDDDFGKQKRHQKYNLTEVLEDTLLCTDEAIATSEGQQISENDEPDIIQYRVAYS